METPIVKISDLGEQYKISATIVGGFLINFGIVEQQARYWIGSLSKDDKVVCHLTSRAKLSQKIDLIKKLIEWSDWVEERKSRSLDLWKEISDISHTRNSVAHNPILVTRENDVYQFRVATKKAPKDVENDELVFITLSDIETKSMRVGNIIELLSHLLHQG